jgi:hypothetical protein
MPLCTSWTATIARLSFCVAGRDNRLPTPHQAAVIREVLDIRKRQTISASEVAVGLALRRQVATLVFARGKSEVVPPN